MESFLFKSVIKNKIYIIGLFGLTKLEFRQPNIEPKTAYKLVFGYKPNQTPITDYRLGLVFKLFRFDSV